MDRSQIVDVVRLLAGMRFSQWKSTAELEEMQSRKLEELAAYSAKNVPYYRKLLSDKRVRSIEDLASLPILKKEDIRMNPASFISSAFDRGRLKKLTTSGSTGMPLEIYHSPAESAYGPAFEIHQLIEAGVGPLDRLAYITKEASRPNILNRFGLFRRDCVEFRSPEQLMNDLRALGPDVIRGTPSFIIPLAHRNMKADRPLRLAKVFCFSEVLSDTARSLIGESFGCRVFDSYGSIETSWITWECDKGSRHLYSDQIIAEVVDGEGNPLQEGQFGNIVLTPLWQRAMPLIRYNLGDRTALGPKCRCGRGSHVLRAIEGRNNDFIILPSGNACSAHLVSFNIRDCSGILQFQSEQSDTGRILIKIVPVGRPRASIESDVKRRLEGVFPEKLRIDVEYVDSLKSDGRGKLRDFVSRLKQS